MKPNGNMWRLHRILRLNGPLTMAEMRVATGWNKTQCRTALDSLRARGIVELSGPGRWVKYGVVTGGDQT